MSQHHISTTRYKIHIGWDGPLQYFFGTVWDITQADRHDEGIVFTTLSLPGGGVGTVAELARLLGPYIELPAELITALSEDQEVNRSNVVHEWRLEDAESE